MLQIGKKLHGLNATIRIFCLPICVSVAERAFGEGQHVLPSVYQLTELHLFAILFSINLGKNAKHMGFLVGSSS